MRLVIIESPFGTKPDGTRCTAEEMARNQRYARACLVDSLQRGEAPFASHVLYPLVLDDTDPAERKMGMHAGFAIGEAIGAFSPLSTSAVYTDLGVTSGMTAGIARAEENKMRVEYRQLGGEWAA